jgi:ribosome-binding factor A
MRRRASHRPERVGEVIRQVVGEFLASEARDPRIGFVTVTGVDVSPDLSHATVRVSVMGSEEERGRTLAGLASAAGYLRSQLSRTLSARITPEVAFTLDRGLEHAERIDRVLRDLRGGAAREDEG